MANAARTANTGEPSDVRWVKAYRGQPDTVREVRHDVRAVLGPCPALVADDVVLVASEFATNAIRHSRSGESGGTFLVRISHCVTVKVPYIWLEVEDQGSASWDGILRPEPTHGLAVIERLATWMGTDDSGNGSRTVYARLEYRAADGMPLHAHDRTPELPEDLHGVREADGHEGDERG